MATRVVEPLPHAFDEIGRGQLQRSRQADDGREPGLAVAALQTADLGRVEPGRVPKVFLRPAAALTRLLEVAAEPLVWLHPTDGRWMRPKAPEPKPL